jgi:N-methylhydantoinase A
VSASKVRLGVDIGGTFTDAIVLVDTTGEFQIEKVPTTPSDLSVGFLDVTTRFLEAAGREPEDIGSLVHGTTVATNCIIEGKTARCGLLTTEGFRDILEIARQIKPEPFNIFFEKPRPLVPRHRCLEASERLDAEGRAVRALAPESVRAAAETFRREGVEAVAVCFLHSYINPSHERLAGEILERELPGIPIALSSEVCPAFREYLRASTTVVNAAIAPVVSTYLGRVEAKLRSRGLQGRLCVMQSHGGVCTFEVARRMPVRIIESGPAAGVTVAAYIGSLTGRRNVISLDIGGTTAKAGLIQDGTPRVTQEFEVGAKAAGRLLHAKATGYPIQSGVVDLVEVGAGGGSIGWVDPGGALRVGPQSAGAEPGPACYGRGGRHPTLTDANLILGRLNPDYFLGGKMRLSRDAADRAVNEHIAGPLNLAVTEAAFGMIEIANAHMIEALRLVSVQRGFDPREFALVAFGGAGALHANAIARELDIPEVIIPLSPGVSSALGLLLADIRHDFVRTYIRTSSRVDLDFVNRAFTAFEEEGRLLLTREGVPPDRQTFVRAIDMRMTGQSFELNVPVGSVPLHWEHVRSLESAFHELHERTYGHSSPGEPVEFVSLRLTARGIISKPRMSRSQPIDGSSVPEARLLKGHRDVCFDLGNGSVPTPIYDRYKLMTEATIPGPAVLEEFDSTVLIHPGYRGTVDEFGSVHIERSSGGNGPP